MNTNRLIEIAQDLEFKDLLHELSLIKQYEDSPSCPLTLPLVGEFSSGKTTLINALTDSKKLETATKPTTATIFEIHFGCTTCSAKVVFPDGNEENVDDIASLKNSELADSAVIEVYDTSTLVPTTTVLVDTPGLSSPDPRHKQTLIEFLPHADAILMVADINQQITRSMVDFVKSMELAKRQIFLVLSKADTKSTSELQAVKEYIGKNIALPLEHICCVSAKNGDLSELQGLLAQIDKSKAEILKQVNSHRLESIRKEMIKRIDSIIASASNNEDTEEELRKQQHELDKMNRSIDRFLDSASMDIEDIQRQTIRDFEDNISNSLDALVTSKSSNFDAQATAAINSTASLLLNDYKSSVAHLLSRLANNSTAGTLNTRCIENMDLSGFAISGISYNLNLNELGHQYDGMIAMGTKIAAAAAVIATAGTALAAGGAAAGGATAASGVAGGLETGAAVLTGSKVIDMVDTASDIGSIVSNRQTRKHVQQALEFAGKVDKQMDKINDYEQKYNQQLTTSKGIVETMVGFVTDKAMGKPQRKRAIREYLDGTLLPEFKVALGRVSSQILQGIKETLKAEAAETTQAVVASIQELKQMKDAEQHAFEERMRLLRGYKKELAI